ncbi:MAG: hypothetical protein JXB38_15525 [Anaerolineales bacterium]|nr:hypothetical protein [Anaerolineales bacterium]
MDAYENDGVPTDLPPEDERQARIRRMILRLVAAILLLVFLFYALSSFLMGFIIGNRLNRQPTPTPQFQNDYEAGSLNFQVSLRTHQALRTPYPPLGNRAHPPQVAAPEWVPAPQTYTVIDQLAWDVAFGFDLDTKGCGPVAAASALADLAYPNAELGVCLPTIRREAGDNYSETYGIQPTVYCDVVAAVVGNGYLGATGEVTCLEAENPVAGVLQINRALTAGSAVIVDVLITTDQNLAGTYLIGEDRQPSNPEQPLAHFTRLLGFEDGGRTVVLAELLHPNAYNNGDVVRVPLTAFLEAWREPEQRARYKPANAEDVSYWMMVISPPQEIVR